MTFATETAGKEKMASQTSGIKDDDRQNDDHNEKFYGTQDVLNITLCKF